MRLAHAVRGFDTGGRPARITDANGITTDLTYTPRGWLATRSVGGVTTAIAYTPYGAVRIHYTLDAAGNKTKEQAASR